MILLDTNVISELMKGAADHAVERWYLLHEEETALPATVLAELAFGVARLGEGARRRGLEARLNEWRLRYAERTIAFGGSAALHYGSILATAEAGGRAMSFPDAQIAAIAMEHDCALATRNIRDFVTTKLKLINPWE